MKRKQWVPLGSIVWLKGSMVKFLVVARGMNVSGDKGEYFFDYGAVPYPRGLTKDELVYFNHEQISSIYYIGCNDAENEHVENLLNDYIRDHMELKRISPEEWAAMTNKTEDETKNE